MKRKVNKKAESSLWRGFLKILCILSIILVAVVMIAVLGIKYMMGSAEEKSEYKKSLLPLLVGAILVFGAATVAKVIVGLASSFT